MPHTNQDTFLERVKKKVNIIGIIRPASLDQQLFLPYYIYVFHISYTIGIIIVIGIKLPDIFGIITYLGMDFF